MITSRIVHDNDQAEQPNRTEPAKRKCRPAPKKSSNNGARIRRFKSPPVGNLVIRLAKQDVVVAPKTLLDDDVFMDLQEQCDGSTKPVTIFLNNLLSFTQEERYSVLDFVASLAVRPEIVVKEGKESCQDLLASILELMPEKQDIEGMARSKAAALEAAALVYPNALDVACNRIEILHVFKRNQAERDD